MQWVWWCATHSSRRKTKLITYQSGDNRSMIDYVMVRKTDRCLVKDVKVISSEECVPQHRMVIGFTHETTEEKNCQVSTKAQSVEVWMRKLLDCSLMKWQLEMMKLLKLMTSKRSGY